MSRLETAGTITTGRKSRRLLIASWIGQIVLGGMFIFAGLTKATAPLSQVVESIPWAADVPLALLRFIGISEFLGGLGLILPGVVRYKQRLIGYAALGITTIMIFATIFHIFRSEAVGVTMNLLIAAISLFVAWARLKKINA